MSSTPLALMASASRASAASGSAWVGMHRDGTPASAANASAAALLLLLTISRASAASAPARLAATTARALEPLADARKPSLSGREITRNGPAVHVRTAARHRPARHSAGVPRAASRSPGRYAGW